jgi:hypothetical protein
LRQEHHGIRAHQVTNIENHRSISIFLIVGDGSAIGLVADDSGKTQVRIEVKLCRSAHDAFVIALQRVCDHHKGNNPARMVSLNPSLTVRLLFFGAYDIPKVELAYKSSLFLWSKWIAPGFCNIDIIQFFDFFCHVSLSVLVDS